MNILNNDDLNCGVIFSDQYKNNTIKCKLFMNDENLKMDNGLLSIYNFMENAKIPKNIHYNLNDNYDGKMWVKVYLNDEFLFESKLGEVDCEDIFWEYID